jgi:hypothetical protein
MGWAKLQGRVRISSWDNRISAQAVRQAAVEPGRQKTQVPLANPANVRDWTVKMPVSSKLGRADKPCVAQSNLPKFRRQVAPLKNPILLPAGETETGALVPFAGPVAVDAFGFRVRWSRARRVPVLRRRLAKDHLVEDRGHPEQPRLSLAELEDDVCIDEYAGLVASLDAEILTVAACYRDRARVDLALEAARSGFFTTSQG